MSRLLFQHHNQTNASPTPQLLNNTTSPPAPPQPVPDPSPSPSPTLPDAGQFYSLLAYSGLGFAGALCIIIVFLCCCVGARSYVQQALRRNRRQRRREQEPWIRDTPDASIAAQHTERGTSQRPYAVKLLVREALFVEQPGDEEHAVGGVTGSPVRKGEEGVTWLALRPSLDDPCEVPEHLRSTDDSDGGGSSSGDAAYHGPNHVVSHGHEDSAGIRGAQSPAGPTDVQGQHSSPNTHVAHIEQRVGDGGGEIVPPGPGAGGGAGEGLGREVEMGRVPPVQESIPEATARGHSSESLHTVSSTFLAVPPAPTQTGQPEPGSNEQW